MQKVIVGDAAAFVVAVERLRRVVRRLRADAELRIAKKAFEATISRYEQARHHLEHLDTAIPAIAPTGHGAIGALSWWYVPDHEVAEFRAILVVPGHLERVRGIGQIEVRTPRARCDHFVATIAGAHYSLTDARDAVVRLENRLRTWSRKFAEVPDT
jgi:hypothetical protein